MSREAAIATRCRETRVAGSDVQILAAAVLLVVSSVGCPHRQGATSETPESVLEGSASFGRADDENAPLPELSDKDRSFLKSQQPRYQRIQGIGALMAKDEPGLAYRASLDLVASEPDFEPAVPIFLELAGMTDHLQEAIDRYGGRVDADPNDGVGWFGLTLMRDGEARLAAGTKAVTNGCRTWDCYLALAGTFVSLERIDEGLDFFRRVGARSGEEPDRTAMAWLAQSELFRYGGGEPKQVEELLKRAVSVAPAGRGREDALERLGMLYTSLQRYENADAALLKALEIHRLRGDWEGQTSVLLNMVALESEQNHLRDAIALAEEALALARKYGDPWFQARSLGMLGDFFMALNEFEKATTYYEPEVVLDRKVENWERLPVALANLGIAYSSQGKREQALGLFEKAQALFEEQDHQEGLAWIKNLIETTRQQETGTSQQKPGASPQETGNQEGTSPD